MQRRPVLRPSVDSMILRALVVLALLGAFACVKPRTAEPPPSVSTDAVASAPQSEKNVDEEDPPPAWTKPFLWRIEGKKPSYLFGTIHVPDARLAPAPAAVIDAFEAAEVLNTEVPMDKASQIALMPRVFLPANKTLNDVLPATTCVRIEGVLGEHQFRWEPFSRMKPWVIATQLTLLDRLALMARQPGLDAGLYQEARDANKEVGGLETAEEQFAAMDGLSAEDQAFLVTDALDALDRQKTSGVDPIAELLDVYIAGNAETATATLEKGSDKKSPFAARIHKRLVTDRNAVMAARIAKRLQSGKSYLFAIGLAHLLGKDSIVTLLAKRGLKVAPVVGGEGEAPTPVHIQPVPRSGP